MNDATFWQFLSLVLYVLGAVHSRSMSAAIARHHFPNMLYQRATAVIYGLLWPLMTLYILAEKLPDDCS